MRNSSTAAAAAAAAGAAAVAALAAVRPAASQGIPIHISFAGQQGSSSRKGYFAKGGRFQPAPADI
eukprot:1045591-Pleurochrysis_carterae.AAC.1